LKYSIKNLISQGLAAGVLLTALVSVFSYLLIRTTLGNPTRPGRVRVARAKSLRGSHNTLSKALMPATYTVSVLSLAFLVFPIYWMLLIAFRPGALNFVFPPLIYPKVFNPAHSSQH
jgi:hypothetical protein